MLKSIEELFEDEEEEGYESDDEEREILFSLFKRVVGSIVILFNPLSTAAITSLIQSTDTDDEEAREETEGLLCHLQSVLKVPANRVDPVRILHPSFREEVSIYGIHSLPLATTNSVGDTRSMPHRFVACNFEPS